MQLVPVNRATNVAVTLRQFADLTIADVRQQLVTAQLSAERVSLLLMVSCSLLLSAQGGGALLGLLGVMLQPAQMRL